MTEKNKADIPSQKPTPREVFFSRRKFMTTMTNVNPNIPHPRWSQEWSYWLHASGKFRTPILNGYDKYVGRLYPDEPRKPQVPLKPGQIAR
jgi:hypothetical protein